MELGILPTVSYKWKTFKNNLDYPPAIFCLNGYDRDEKMFYEKDYVTLVIDTEKISNKWYSDLNLTYSHKVSKSKDLFSKIMTFEPIPPEAIIDTLY